VLVLCLYFESKLIAVNNPKTNQTDKENIATQTRKTEFNTSKSENISPQKVKIHKVSHYAVTI
jgi:hypothetical protein